MSKTLRGKISAEESLSEPDDRQQSQSTYSDRPLAISLGKYAAAGMLAALLLTIIESIDLQIQLSPVFASTSERFILTSYFSLNLVVGSLIGLVVGLSAAAMRWARERALDLMSGASGRGWALKAVAGAAVVMVFAAVVYFQPSIFNFTLGVIREAEKIALARVFLKAERLFVYLAIVGMVVACVILRVAARACGSMHRLLRLSLLLGVLALILAAYYVDSRIEVLQYQFSLHRTMFLVAFALSMSLVSSIDSAFPSLFPSALARLRSSRFLSLSLAALLAASVSFTFFNFDRNHNLKTQLFFRSTQAKQFFSIAQWALDFDRDGYSAWLGGGDADDFDSRINPARVEVAEDGVDNNCIGGDATRADVEQWLGEHQRLNTAANANPSRFNIIYIFVDTVRADHLSVYGYPRVTSPNLSKLAERSSVFDNAFTPSPSTYQAVPKFMQSSFWDAHVETWTEVLARNGYETVLYPGRRASTLYRRIKDPRLIGSARTNNIKETVDAIIEQFERAVADHPACTYLYTFEPHMPYRTRRDFYFGTKPADLYDGEIAYTDHHLGRLFDYLDRSGKIDNTMIVVMADHGESLGERGVYKHNAQLYNEQMHVPMIIHVPGLEPRRIDQYVSTIDLGSTILNTVGIPCPKEYVGTSLLPIMRGDDFTHPPVFGEHWQRNDSPFWGPERNVDPEIRKYMVVTQDGFKLIYNANFACFELFDLKNDPKEERNLYDARPEKAAQMKLLLGRFIDVVSLGRPADADEQRFFRGTADD